VEVEKAVSQQLVLFVHLVLQKEKEKEKDTLANLSKDSLDWTVLEELEKLLENVSAESEEESKKL